MTKSCGSSCFCTSLPRRVDPGGVGVSGVSGVSEAGAGDWALVPTLPQIDIVGQLFKAFTHSQPERSTWREGWFYMTCSDPQRRHC